MNLNIMRPNLRLIAIYGTLSMLLLLSACFTLTETPPASQLLLATPVQIDAAALTRQKNDADNQAAAAAEIVRANAQATFNSANATLSAVQTQQQSDANVVAAQIAAIAEVARANAQATLNSAGSTQSAALTQDAIRQTQMADLATTGAQAIANQQFKDELAAGTQTAVVNNISTQVQAAAVTSQWYADQERQRKEQRQGRSTFLWMWCLPAFVVLFAGLILWGVWRRLTIQQANQRILEKPVDRLPAPAPHHHHGGMSSHLDSDIADDGYQVTNPDDQVEKWLDEVKDKLLDRDEKDKDDNPDD